MALFCYRNILAAFVVIFHCSMALLAFFSVLATRDHPISLGCLLINLDQIAYYYNIKDHNVYNH